MLYTLRAAQRHTHTHLGHTLTPAAVLPLCDMHENKKGVVDMCRWGSDSHV